MDYGVRVDVAGELAAERAVAKDDHAVTQRCQLTGVAAGDDDRAALGGHAAHHVDDVLSGTDIDGLRRLLEQQELGVSGEPLVAEVKNSPGFSNV